MIEFTDTLLRVAKQGAGWTVSWIVDFLTDKTFKTIIFMPYSKSFAECEGVTDICTGERITADRFGTVLVSSSVAKKHGCGPLYMKIKTRMNPEPVEF